VGEGPEETRGRKEGKHIGHDLPRRIGLAGEHADEGWMNVKRVVVVGVHGWLVYHDIAGVKLLIAQVSSQNAQLVSPQIIVSSLLIV
jgi:hypothetical protein